MAGKRRKRRILIVDDDELMRELLERTLTRAGFQTSTAPNGLKLVAHLNASRPDLILLDVHMSWVNGFDLCRLIRRTPQHRGTPVVFVSGLSDAASIQQGLACGALDYVTKPFDVDDLVRRVRKGLGLDHEPPLPAPAAEWSG
jgi:DNA-binding response OmpR family regulator